MGNQSSTKNPHEHFPSICFHGVMGSGKSSLRDWIAYYTRLSLNNGRDEMKENDSLHYHKIVLSHCLKALMEYFFSLKIVEEGTELEFDLQVFAYEYFEARNNETKSGFCFAVSNPLFLKEFVNYHESLESLAETGLFLKIIWEKYYRKELLKSNMFENIEMYFDVISTLMNLQEIPPVYHILSQYRSTTDSFLDVVRKYTDPIPENPPSAQGTVAGSAQTTSFKNDEGFNITEIGSSTFQRRLSVSLTRHKSNYCVVSLSDFDEKGEGDDQRSRLDQSLELCAKLINSRPDLIVVFTKVDKFFEKITKGVMSPFLLEVISSSNLQIPHEKEHILTNERYCHQVLNCILQAFEMLYEDESSFKYHLLNLKDQDETKIFTELFWEYEEQGKFTQFTTSVLNSHAFYSIKDGLQRFANVSEFSDLEFIDF